MPNGDDKNWMRLCASIEGFRIRYSTWPVRVRLQESAIGDLKHLLSPEQYSKVCEKIEIVLDPSAEFIAEDDRGWAFNYGKEGASGSGSDIPASVWLGVSGR